MKKSVFKTPCKKRVQKNTIDRYFHSPKTDENADEIGKDKKLTEIRKRTNKHLDDKQTADITNDGLDVIAIDNNKLSSKDVKSKVSLRSDEYCKAVSRTIKKFKSSDLNITEDISLNSNLEKTPKKKFDLCTTIPVFKSVGISSFCEKTTNSHVLCQEQNNTEVFDEHIKEKNIPHTCENKELVGSPINVEITKKKSISPEKKKISGPCFKRILCSFQCNNFYKTYNKLGDKHIPECCDKYLCNEKHKNIKPTSINSFWNGSFFNILDNPLEFWLYDIAVSASTLLRQDQYFRGDVLRIMFDYILNGPSEDMMWDVKSIILSHWEIHPPCLKELRDCYLQLLYSPFTGDCYFKTELASVGILNYIIRKLEEVRELIKPEECKKNNTEKIEKPEDLTTSNGGSELITFELLEERYNNFKPLFEKEYHETMDDLDNIADNPTQRPKTALSNQQSYNRLIIALELVVDLVEADFLICIEKLKRFVSSEDNNEQEKPVPLITPFMDGGLEKVFTMYTNTTDEAELTQLSRLIGVMAETAHLFKQSTAKLWQYPNIDSDVSSQIANPLSTIFTNSEWNVEDKLFRLRTLQPDWLRLKIAMSWINKELNVAMGSDLKALVEIIHMHVKSAIKLERDVKGMKKHDKKISSNQSPKFIKRATRRNHYGETGLHRLCKQKSSNLSDIQQILDLHLIDINTADNYGWTPLHEAVGSGSVTKTELLLQYQPPQGASPVNIGAQNCKGSTPLHEAVQLGNLEMCKLLVEYGGVCLLRKMDCEEVTPLDMSEGKPDIKKYFERVLKAQETLNLCSLSELNLPEHLIKLLIMACDAFISDHYTWQVYRVIRFDESFKQVEPKHWIVNSYNTLVRFRNDQEQFRKLRKILSTLAENPKNSTLLKLWDSKFQIIQIQPSGQYLTTGPSQKGLVKNNSENKSNNDNLLAEVLHLRDLHLTDSPA